MSEIPLKQLPYFSSSRGSFQRRTILALLAANGFLSACAPPKPAMRVGTIVFPGYELLFLARELGKLNPGLVRLVELQNSSDSVRALAAGEIEAALLTLDEMMSACAGGVELCAVAVLDTSFGADQVLAKPGITMENLAKARVAAEDNSVGALMMASLLEAAKLSINQVVKVPITQSRATEFYQKGLTDVVITAEPWASQIKALGGHTIFDSTSVPDRIVDVIAVRAELLETYAPAIQHLVDAQFIGLDFFHTNTAQATPLLAPRLQLQPSEVVSSYDGLKLPDRKENQTMLKPQGTLAKNLPGLQSILLTAKLLPKVIDTKALLDDRFVKKGSAE